MFFFLLFAVCSISSYLSLKFLFNLVLGPCTLCRISCARIKTGPVGSSTRGTKRFVCGYDNDYRNDYGDGDDNDGRVFFFSLKFFDGGDDDLVFILFLTISPTVSAP